MCLLWLKAAIASSARPLTANGAPRQSIRRIEISRRAGLDPPIEMNLPLRTRKTEELSDVAACDAIVDQSADQDPLYGSGQALRRPMLLRYGFVLHDTLAF